MSGYTNTVLEKTFADATIFPWLMFLFTGPGTPPKEQIEVYAKSNTNELTLVPIIDYDVTINPLLPEQFNLSWTPPPGPPGAVAIIIFRRVTGLYEPFLPGAFLSAEALNSRFNLLTLSVTDLDYYQAKTIPRYSAQAIANHGEDQSDLLKGMKTDDLDLPFLGAGEPQDTVMIWGKKLTDNSGNGTFLPYVYETPGGGGNLPQFKAELLQGCPAATSGAQLVHCCAPAGAAGGPSMSLQNYVGVSLPNATIAVGTIPGAGLVGVNVGGVQSNVQDFLNVTLPAAGTAPLYDDAGADKIGYGGLSTAPNTVSSSLNALITRTDRLKKIAEPGESIVGVFAANQSTFTIATAFTAPYNNFTNLSRIQAEIIFQTTGSTLTVRVPVVSGIDYNCALNLGNTASVPFPLPTGEIGVWISFLGTTVIRLVAAQTTGTWGPTVSAKLYAYLKTDYV